MGAGRELRGIVQAAYLDHGHVRHAGHEREDRRAAISTEPAARLASAVGSDLEVLELTLGQLEAGLGNYQNRGKRAAGRALAVPAVAERGHHRFGRDVVSDRTAHTSAG